MQAVPPPLSYSFTLSSFHPRLFFPSATSYFLKCNTYNFKISFLQSLAILSISNIYAWLDFLQLYHYCRYARGRESSNRFEPIKRKYEANVREYEANIRFFYK